MPFGIIIKGKPSRERYAIIRTPAQATRRRVSRQNRQEYDNEKRALEMEAKMPCGKPEEKAIVISKMMCVGEKKVEKWIKNKKKSKVVLDGKID